MVLNYCEIILRTKKSEDEHIPGTWIRFLRQDVDYEVKLYINRKSWFAKRTDNFSETKKEEVQSFSNRNYQK